MARVATERRGFAAASASGRTGAKGQFGIPPHRAVGSVRRIEDRSRRRINIVLASQAGPASGEQRRTREGVKRASLGLNAPATTSSTDARKMRLEEKRAQKMKKKLQLGAKDDSLEDEPVHFAALTAAGLLDAALLIQGASGAAHDAQLQGMGPLAVLSQASAETALAVALGYVFADLGTGIFHFAVDNYGDGSTPVFGNVIAAFQGHHRQPWSITIRGAANNLYPLVKPAIPFLMLFAALPISSFNDVFLASFIAFVVLSQQFHRLSHFKRSQLSPLVVALQDAGLLVSITEHGAHHRVPFNRNYCIVSGIWNQPLTVAGFFPALENAIVALTGVEPRCWAEPDYDWIGDSPGYYEDDADEVMAEGPPS